MEALGSILGMKQNQKLFATGIKKIQDLGGGVLGGNYLPT